MRRLSRAARPPIGRKPGRWLKADLVDRSAAEAIHERQLRLWYQPVIRIMDHYLYGIEALARWSHPRRGLLTPGQFLPALRQAGHLRALDEWALTQACSDFRELHQDLGDRSPPFLAVNLSADTVCTEFHHLVEKVLDDTGVAASQLVLELSEDIELDELTAATPRLEHLRVLGVRLMLDDIGHPHRDDAAVYDLAFENVQAGERTSHLFRLANLNNAIVVGTGDLSELALGWCTYGVGDHMSHYAINASVPKTLIQHVIRWVADTQRFGAEASATLIEILATQISPELVPSRVGVPDQETEAIVGPYELQDFNLYFTLRFGFSPPKIAFLAWSAWHNREQGSWPDIPADKRNQYDLAAIKKHLRTFLYRFFQTSQFKRSCIPNAPKVGSGGSLSPRGDYRAPSDSEATAWLEQLKLIPDQD